MKVNQIEFLTILCLCTICIQLRYNLILAICYSAMPTNTIGTRSFPFAPPRRVVGSCPGPGRWRTCHDAPLSRLQRGREDISRQRTTHDDIWNQAKHICPSMFLNRVWEYHRDCSESTEINFDPLCMGRSKQDQLHIWPHGSIIGCNHWLDAFGYI